MTSFVLAHLSDPHLAPLPRPQPHELLGKRALGYLNWTRGRRLVHRRDVLDTLVADTLAQRPDHIAVTGDLVNIALPGEIAQAADWLHGLGRASDVTLVPGNHDAYVHGALAAATRAWGAYMQGDNAAAAPGAGFPFVRRRGPLTMIGVSSAVATPWFRATGRVGKEQLDKLRDALTRLGEEGRFRLVLIHHPPESVPKRKAQRLLDGPALREVIADAGAELLIHGHDHIHQVSWFDAGDRRMAAVGVPSASAKTGGRWEAAGYNLYRIEGEPGTWRCEMSSRSLDGDGKWIDRGGRNLTRGLLRMPSL